MSFRGFLIRLVYVAFATWILVAFVESFGWALYFALLSLFYFEVLRPRRTRKTINPKILNYDTHDLDLDVMINEPQEMLKIFQEYSRRIGAVWSVRIAERALEKIG